MKIYISHSRKFDFQNELYKVLRESELNSNHEFILPHEQSDMPFNTKELFMNKGCDVVVAEVSYPATGQGIELGWADMLEIPIICIYKEGIEPSQSLHTVSKRFLMYTSSENMLEDISGALRIYE
nr:Unknown Function [uncultured bacterium]